MQRSDANYSIGFNFDQNLIDGLIDINNKLSGFSRITEVFAALPDSPISSARPTSRIPRISWNEFKLQVEKLRCSDIKFNFLMNTAQRVDNALITALKVYLRRLLDAGVERITVGTPTLCRVLKSFSSQFHITISITYGTNSIEKLSKAIADGADSVYLDGVHVNRNFKLLRTLLKHSDIECRLYANMSCLAACPVVKKHYKLFAGRQTESTATENDILFTGCSMIKLNNTVEWMQMPWIRPEDIPVYVSEGVKHFKLADRLSPTESLLTIARSYLTGKSPDNLFVLMEREGTKYRIFSNSTNNEMVTPIWVESRLIPNNFIEHFQSGECDSNNRYCKFCKEVANNVIRVVNEWKTIKVPTELFSLIPQELKDRAII